MIFLADTPWYVSCIWYFIFLFSEYVRSSIIFFSIITAHRVFFWQYRVTDESPFRMRMFLVYGRDFRVTSMSTEAISGYAGGSAEDASYEKVGA
jgi:hypothetical protein